MAGIDLSTLNASQRNVATRLDEPLFVAAGAGSGKTYTLTARLVHALSKGSGPHGGRYIDSINEALVITFTKAAAMEIKDRVRGALRAAGEDDPHLKEESLRVDGAWISTIHGMCSTILKRYGVEEGVDAGFEVAEESVAEALIARALDEVLGEAERLKEFEGLFREFPLYNRGGDDSNSIAGMIRKIRIEANKCAHGFDDLEFPTSDETPENMRSLLSCLESMAATGELTEKQLGATLGSIDAMNRFFEYAPSERTPEHAVETLSAVQLPNRFSKQKAYIVMDSKLALYDAYWCAQYERVQCLATQIVDLAKRVDDRYKAFKHELSMLDNDDLVESALMVVENHPEVAEVLKSRFKLVMIDEFQDTDEKQLRLISLLSGTDAEHLTTVGDSQQAIYRFRGGDVEVFRARGKSLPPESHVEMDVNYRSDHHVLAFVERVCGDGGLLGDFLKLAGCGTRKTKYVARDVEGNMPPRVFLEVVQGGKSSENSAVNAAEIADRLAELVREGQSVGSMALLLGRTSNVGLYLEALRSRGLPTIVTGGSSFSGTTEVTIIQALLHTLANPHDTEAGLFRLLSSDMFRLDADDFLQMVTMRQKNLDAPCKRAFEEVFVSGDLTLYNDAEPSERLRLAHEVMSRAFSRLGTWQVADVCMAVVNESGWLERLAHEGNDGLAVAANVLAAIRYVRELTQSFQLGVAQTAKEFDNWLAVTKVTPKNLSGDSIEAVQVMTIHGSKGLQFAVTAVAECWSDPKVSGRLLCGKTETGRKIVVKPRLDADQSKIATKIKGMVKGLDHGPEGRVGNVFEEARAIEEAEVMADAAEKSRLLYVALTRAEEALVVGVPIAGAQQYQSKLALAMLGSLTGELPTGVSVVGFEPSLGIECEYRETDGAGETVLTRRKMALEPALMRVVTLIKEKGAPVIGESAGTLAGFDGELPESSSEIVVRGVANPIADVHPAPSSFELFEMPQDDVVCYRWREREDIYSYSSLRRVEEAGDEDVDLGLEKALADAEEELSFAADFDKATSLGSAFHALAQTMVETGRDHDPQTLEALSTTWGLSLKQRQRLESAIGWWETSDVRAETQGYELRRAEVPFFMVRPEPGAGNYIEGAIDLLCTHGTAPAGEALVVDYKTGDADLTEDEIWQLHERQAALYADVLLRQGFDHVKCAFVSVEQGVVSRYDYE